MELRIPFHGDLTVGHLLRHVGDAVDRAIQESEQGASCSPPLEMSIECAEIPVRWWFSLGANANALTGSMEYVPARAELGTTERMAVCWQVLLHGMSAHPGTLINHLPILTAECRRQVMGAFNRTAMAHATDDLIHELFERQTERTPDAIAVMSDKQSLTYSELNKRANCLARYLENAGVGADELVGICVERGLDTVVGLLGVLKAGGAYVPLDPAYPPERLRHMLQDAAPKVVLTQQSLKVALPPSAAKLIALDSDWGEIARHDSGNRGKRAQQLTSRHLAYVIYTSGSTGKPKGVMVEHRGVVNILLSMQQRPGIAESDCLLAITTLSFDIAALEIFLPLISGAKLVLASREAASDAQHLMSLIDRFGVTVLQATPATWQMLVVSGWSGRPGLKALCGGEALTHELAAKLIGRIGTLWNLYGPTETTIWSCVHQIVTPSEHVSVESIGRPIANTQVYILDQQQQAVPIGVAGEIFIGGDGVARGYFNRAQLTAERFVANPFGTDPRSTLYRTGDLGRWCADGTIEYLGRNDQQVKIRGFRIELGEIEAELLRHAQVAQAVVIGRQDESDEKRLVAYVIPSTAVTSTEVLPSVESMRTLLMSTLPQYMIPSAFVMLASFPLTPNGKLDRRALPAPPRDAYAHRPYEAPQGEVEQFLAVAWQELLKADRVGRHDNFFELGGDSLLVVRLMKQLRDEGLSADVRSVLGSSTLACLAGGLTKDATRTHEVPPNLIPAECDAITPRMLPLVDLHAKHIGFIAQAVRGGVANILDIYPLTPLQEGILFHHLLNGQGGDTYVLSMLMSLSSREKLEDLVGALQEVIDRHDVLRTAVLWEQLPQPVQVVWRQAALPVEVLVPDQHRGPVEQLREQMTPKRQRLDLTRAPLMRLQIATDTHSAESYALLQVHHLTHDHESMEAMLAELKACLERRGHTLPEPVPYRNHVAQTLARAQDSDFEAFFRGKLAEIVEPTASFGLSDLGESGDQIDETRSAIEPSLATRIRVRSRHLGVSPATLFHVGWALVVALTSGRDDIVFGTLLSGRLQIGVDAQRMLGMFVNTLPLRLLLKNVTTRALVEQTQRELADLLHNEQAPLAVAQRCAGTSGSAPLFNSLFNYLHSPPGATTEPFEIATGIEVLARREWTNYPITLSVEDHGEGFGLIAQTDRRIGAQRIVSYLQKAMQSLVETLEQTPGAPALSLQVLPQIERHQVIDLFNATQTASSRVRLLHESFEDQASRTPSAVAVICAERQLTYQQLNRRANQLAHALVAHGVRPDDRVGIYINRSPEMVIAMLGVLKAGAAYVPLDTNYPPERLSYLVSDCAPVVMLTEARVKERLPKSRAPVLVLNADEHCDERELDHNPEPTRLGLEPHHLAYLIYTSGSTGTPKGVMVEHRNVVNLVHWHCETFHVKGGCRSSCLAALGFDAAVWEIWPSLSAGATLVLAPPGATRDAESLLAWWQSESLDVSFMPTPMAEITFSRDILNPQLHTLLVGGDRLRSHPGPRPFCVVNNYGPTEATVVSTSGLIREADDILHIGRPISNARIYILDAYLR
ncbi:MAG: amino acid adenylation domain-containing protein, partial [Gammaproteobacteria bacterium]